MRCRILHRPMDIIFIDDLRVETLIGIYPREKAVPQTIEISLRIGSSTASAGASDDIRDTIDYAVVGEGLLAQPLLESLGHQRPGLRLVIFQRLHGKRQVEPAGPAQHTLVLRPLQTAP